jgi:transposase InsO family protein
MNIHKNARTTPYSRALMVARVRAGQPVAAVARTAGVSPRTTRKWVQRAAEAVAELTDRSCRPRHSPRALGMPVVLEIERLRRRRWTGAQIAEALGVSRATVARTLGQLDLARLRALDPPPPSRRYEWARPGQLVHVDIKKLGRIQGRVGHRITGERRGRVHGAGWEFVHVCIDDCSRLAYAEVLANELGVTVAAFLRRAVTWFARRGVRVQRVLSDNGSGYRSQVFAAACQACAVQPRRTRPYTPRTNGKAERFIQTMLREWAYAQPYHSSAARTAALTRWLHYYNVHRRHTALHGQPPLSRLDQGDNLLRLHN